MKQGVSSYSFARYLCEKKMTLCDVIRKAAEIGFEGIEMANITDEWLDLSYDLEELKRTAQEANIEICSWALSADYAGEDTAAEIARVKKEIDQAHFLGCSVVRTDVCDDSVKDRYAPQIIESLRELSDYCAEKGITLVVENHGSCFCLPERLDELCRRVGKSNFGLLCDFANYADAGADTAYAVAMTRPLIRHVHMKDCHLLNGDRVFPGDGWYVTSAGSYWRCAITGQGNLPLYACLKSLRESGYSGWLIQEFEGIEDPIYAVAQGLRFTKRLLQALDYGVWKEEE